MSKELPEELYWLDFETTGLTDHDWILECAIYRAPFLNPFEIECVIDTPVFFMGDYQSGKLPDRRNAQDQAQRPDIVIDPFVIEMHTKNGLWKACKDPKLPNFIELEDLILQAVPETPKGEHLPVLAGSSLGALDVPIMKSAMPRAAARFSHRVLDVSAIKLDCCSQGMPPLPKAEAHRAYADILESVAHLKACRAWQRSALATLVGGA